MSVSDICAFIVLVLLCSVIVFVFIVAIRYDYLYKKQQKDFIKNLNEHDKAVVLDFEKCLLVSFKDIFKRQKDDDKR